MKCVVVAGGAKPGKKTFIDAVKRSDISIAADKGLEVFYKYNIIPDIIMGDFDSVDKNILDYFKNIEKIKFPSHKDETDSAIAIEKAIECGADEILFLGATGNRLDHLFANIGLLKFALEKGVKCNIIDKNNEIFMINKSTVLNKSDYKYFSLQSFSDCVRNLSIVNAKYTLNNYDLKMGDGITISNEFLDKPVEVNFDSGTLIVFYSRD